MSIARLIFIFLISLFLFLSSCSANLTGSVTQGHEPTQREPIVFTNGAIITDNTIEFSVLGAVCSDAYMYAFSTNVPAKVFMKPNQGITHITLEFDPPVWTYLPAQEDTFPATIKIICGNKIHEISEVMTLENRP